MADASFPNTMIYRAETLLRKIYWKLRWKVLNSPFKIRNWHNGYTISIPLSGSAAQIFYRKYSEPRLARWMGTNIRSGDRFIDIGAHVGEYSLIAAAAVGPEGTLLALEPQKDLCEIIHRNFFQNGITNSRVVHGALGEKCGLCHLFTDNKNKGAVLDLNSQTADIPMLDLATLLEGVPSKGATWMKLDAAGYELPCLTASLDCLERHSIHLILKAYNENEVRKRFPDFKSSLSGFLASMGYSCFKLRDEGPTPWDGIVHGYCEAILCYPRGYLP